MRNLLPGCLILWFIFLAGCGREQVPEVEFILSNRFNGHLVDLQLDEKEGIEIPLRKGRYELKVPPGGIVRLRSLEPLLAPHSQKVFYEGGASIPLPGETPAALNPNRKYWWPIGRSTLRSDGEETTTRLIFRIAKPTEAPPIDVFALADSIATDG